MSRGEQYLYDRARNITQRDKSLKEEENHMHLMKTFIEDGYPRAFVRSAAVRRPLREPSIDSNDSDDDETSKTKPPVAFLPFVAVVRERNRKVCQDFNVRTVFKSGPTLRNLLTTAKKNLPDRHNNSM